jgi:hypothetical protein
MLLILRGGLPSTIFRISKRETYLFGESASCSKDVNRLGERMDNLAPYPENGPG